MREKWLFRITQLLVYFTFVVGTIAWLTMPWMLERYLYWLMRIYLIVPAYRSFVLVFVMTCGAGVLWIVGELALILRTLDSDPFVQRNVRALRRIGMVAVLLSALFFAKCIHYLSPMTLVVAAMLIVLGLFALVVASVFQSAVRYKQENDLTI